MVYTLRLAAPQAIINHICVSSSKLTHGKLRVASSSQPSGVNEQVDGDYLRGFNVMLTHKDVIILIYDRKGKINCGNSDAAQVMRHLARRCKPGEQS